MTQQVSDVWTLETGDQDSASDDLNLIINEAMKFKGGWARAYLRKLWGGESWKSIKAKLQVEGSDWYVWYMDGVNAHLINLKKQQIDDETNEMIESAKQWNDLNINLRSAEVAIILHSLEQAEYKAYSVVLKTAIHDLISRIETAETET